ncbi:MAG: S-adenosylmethionine decarboxylase proenzyme [Armatimonadetes bacterium]|nr:S-adenosylmethionine decarboxylase proenzyme [Armatimonadota bacterium]
MQALGCHIIAELSECRPSVLSNMEQVKQIMIEAAERANTQVRAVAFHKFSPQGISGVVVIAESHLSIHTWPEYGYAAIDIYTCGEQADPWKACRYITEQFEAGRVSVTTVDRGIKIPQGWYGHSISSRSVEGGVPVAKSA